MDRGFLKRVILFAGFILMFVLGFFAAMHLYLVNNSIKVYNPSSEDNNEIQVIELKPANILDGKVVNLNRNNEVWFYLKDKYYSFRLSEIFPSMQGASLYIDELPLNIIFTKDQKRKIDLDLDGFYDVSVYLNSVSLDSAVFLFQKIHEKVSAGDNLMFWFENIQGNVSKSVERHNYVVLIFFVLLFIFILFLIHFSMPYVLNYFKTKKMKDRTSYTEVMDYLIKEFKKAKKKDSEKAKRIYHRMKFVYDNLSVSMQRRFKSSIEEIKRELNE